MPQVRVFAVRRLRYRHPLGSKNLHTHGRVKGALRRCAIDLRSTRDPAVSVKWFAPMREWPTLGDLSQKRRPDSLQDHCKR
jgi:hypothetical protein